MQVHCSQIFSRARGPRKETGMQQHSTTHSVQITGQQTGVTIGVDLSDRYSSFCILDADGTVAEEGRVRTTTPALQRRFGTLAPCRVVLEVGTHSPWMSRLLAGLGHEVGIAHPRVGPYLGLTPRQRQSGARSPQLPISKAGDRYLRQLLVGCAHYILGPFGPDCDLRRWGLRYAPPGARNAKHRAVVAVARKLAVLLHHLWVTGEAYQPVRQAQAAGRREARTAGEGGKDSSRRPGGATGRCPPRRRCRVGATARSGRAAVRARAEDGSAPVSEDPHEHRAKRRPTKRADGSGAGRAAPRRLRPPRWP